MDRAPGFIDAPLHELYLSVTFTVYVFNTPSVKYRSCTCASEAYVVNFRVKSIYEGFLKIPFSMALVYTFIKKYVWR